MRDSFGISKNHGCEVIQIERSVYYYQSKRKKDVLLDRRITEIAQTRVRYGYFRIYILLRREGWIVNHKKVYRIYKEKGLELRYKRPKRRVSAKINDCWSMDFVRAMTL